MAKYQPKTNSKVVEIFVALDAYREFCVEYGYVFNEAHLNDMNSYQWRNYKKFVDGKEPNMQQKLQPTTYHTKNEEQSCCTDVLHVSCDWCLINDVNIVLWCVATPS